MRGLCALILALAPVTAAAAQQLVVSPAPEAVSVTAYRNPNRLPEEQMQLYWLGGYALVTETRTIDLPAGTSEIRFEGVADSLLPASVIVTGLPRQPAEKNYDARLLSPGALIDAYLGQQVHLRRTHLKTGKVTETEAIVRSGPNGIVLQTPAGFEALRCTGLPETLTYNNVPQGLSDKPTLAIRASAAEPTHATVRLSYLASQFDWDANYVAMLNQDGRTLDLFAWLTLANGNDASFPAAQASAVAGQPNRDQQSNDGTVEAVSPQISLECWQAGTTSDVGSGLPPGVPPPPPPPPPPAPERDAEAIVVTGSRMMAPKAAMVAQQEDLGDLKLYRIPEPVTVAANAQKQVALLTKDRVPVDRLHKILLSADGEVTEPASAQVLLRMKNVKVRGLGLPLPSGKVAVFETVDGRPMLAGEPSLADKAIGENVELVVGESPDVTWTHRAVGAAADGTYGPTRRYELELNNARSQPTVVEVELRVSSDRRIVRPSRKLGKKNGWDLWRVELPANKRLTLAYTVEPVPETKAN